MIELRHISLEYEATSTKHNFILKEFNLKIDRGEFACILGPSGCGKSTLLNLIAGFIPPSDGAIVLGKKDFVISYVFQNHNIFPWMTVRQNIAVGLRRGTKKADATNQINRIAEEVGLYEYLESYPAALSGGMKQRVGIARALVGNPDIILMDEPFAALDAITAAAMRNLLIKLRKNHNTTTVFVTHNIDEAVQLGTRIVVMAHKPARVTLDVPVSGKKDAELKNKIHAALSADHIDELV